MIRIRNLSRFLLTILSGLFSLGYFVKLHVSRLYFRLFCLKFVVRTMLSNRPNSRLGYLPTCSSGISAKDNGITESIHGGRAAFGQFTSSTVILLLQMLYILVMVWWRPFFKSGIGTQFKLCSKKLEWIPDQVVPNFFFIIWSWLWEGSRGDLGTSPWLTGRILNTRKAKY